MFILLRQIVLTLNRIQPDGKRKKTGLAEQLTKLKTTTLNWTKLLAQYTKWALENDGLLDATELAQIARLKGDIAAIQARVALIEKKKGLNGMQMPTETTADKLACAGYRLEDVDLMPITDASGLLIGYTATRVLTVVEIDCEKGDHISFSNLYDAALNKGGDDKLLAPSLLTPASGVGEIPSTAIYAAAFSETGLQKLLPLATSDIGSSISIPLRWIDIPEKTKPKASPLDIAFEEVIEFERRVETGSTKKLVDDYKHALETFQHVYEESSEKKKALWKKAKTHVDNELKGLEKRYESFNQLLQSTGAASGTYFVTTWEDEKYAYTRVEYYTGQSQNLSYNPQDTPNGGQNQKAGLTVHYFLLNEQGVYLSKGKEANFKGFAITCYDVLKSKIDAGSARAFHVNPVEDSNINYDYLNRTHDGAGPWWVTLKKPLNQPVADEIEVPDWEEFKFNEFAATFDAECAALNLPKGKADVLRTEMANAISQQKERLSELKLFSQENKNPEEMLILIQVWEARIIEFEKRLEAYHAKAECIQPLKAFTPPTCTDFDEIYTKLQESCDVNALPEVLAKNYVSQMRDCLKQRTDAKAAQEVELNRVKDALKIDPTSSGYLQQKQELEQRIADLQKDIDDYEPKLKETVEMLEKSGWECLEKNKDFFVQFDSNNNAIIGGKSLIIAYLEDVVAPALQRESSLKVVIIGHVGDSNASPSADGKEVPNGTAAQNIIMVYKDKTKDAKPNYYEDKVNSGLPTDAVLGNLMLLRAAAIRAILEKEHNINRSQIIIEKGTYEKDDKNRKVTISFSM